MDITCDDINLAYKDITCDDINLAYKDITCDDIICHHMFYVLVN
jgi:hypothetical protein